MIGVGYYKRMVQSIFEIKKGRGIGVCRKRTPDKDILFGHLNFDNHDWDSINEDGTQMAELPKSDNAFSS